MRKSRSASWVILVLLAASGLTRAAFADLGDCPNMSERCSCPSGCNQDYCEKDCYAILETPSGHCVYHCGSCQCGGVGAHASKSCDSRPAAFLAIIDSFVTPARAQAASASGTIEIKNPDGDFMVIDKKEASKYEDQSAGIGISVGRDSGGWATVASIAAGGPAANAGLKPEERILSIDGRTTKGAATSQVSQWLRGRPATFVVLKLQPKAGKVHQVTINRVDLSQVFQDKHVMIKTVRLQSLKSDKCPALNDGCHFVYQEKDSCYFSCKTRDE